MTIIAPSFDKGEVKVTDKDLNTFKLETWKNHWKPLSEICPDQISWEEIDTAEWRAKVFSLENRKKAWWENYNETNELTTKRLNWKEDKKHIPWFIVWWMWVLITWKELQEATALEAENNETTQKWEEKKYFMSSNLSTILIGASREPNLLENDWEWFQKYWHIVEKKFYDLFEWELWLTREQINEHFLKTDDNLNLDPENFQIDLSIPRKDKNLFLDSSFQTKWKHWTLKLMKDLYYLYHDVKSSKDKWIPCLINDMYKSTWYVASLKVAALAWVDAITTGAWIPTTWHLDLNIDVNPKDIVSDFYTSIWGEDLKMPAFWLIVSITMVFAPGYDYYIDEDPRDAGWHQWATENMLAYEKRVWKVAVLKSLRKRELIKEGTPIYAGGWIGCATDVKEVLDMWFDWVRVWTTFAVSEQAVDWEWEDFKKALISWNHYWEETEIDEITKNAVKELRDNIDKELIIFRKKFEEILWVSVNNTTVNYMDFIEYDTDSKFGLDSIIKLSVDEVKEVINIFENEIFKKEKLNYAPLSEEQINLYDYLSEKLYEKYGWDVAKLKDELMEYWNLQKAFSEFEKFDKLWEMPTHLLIDSVVWFIWRIRIEWWEHRLLNWTIMKAIICVECITKCILRNVWWIPRNKWSKFCIKNSLLIETRNKSNDLIVNFSWRTTCFYPEIRPAIDIAAAFVWTEVVR